MNTRQIPSRRHGLQRPFNKYQLMSWTLFFVELAITVLGFAPPLDPAFRIAAGGALIVLLILSLTFALVCSGTDPTDPVIAEVYKSRELGEDFVTDLKHYCSLCDSHVQARTKHCGQCNRCVNTFDHHCQWLNNCVGERNYGYFAKTILFMFLHSTLKMGLGGYLIHKRYVYSDNFHAHSEEFYGTEKAIWAAQILVVVSILINFFFWWMMIQLIFLHIWLHAHNMTTYEYIVKKREAKALEKAQKEGLPAPTGKKSKVIQRLDEENQNGVSAQQAGSTDQTVLKLIPGKNKSSGASDNSQIFGSHDVTKEQEYPKTRPGERHRETTFDQFKTYGNATTSHQLNIKTEGKKFGTENKSPNAILHETSMSMNDSVNDDLGTNDIKMERMLSNKKKNMKELKSMGSGGTGPTPIRAEDDEEAGEATFETELNQFEEPMHIELPDLECDLSIEDKSHETSKIYKIMETVRENVLFKNPLNKFFLAGSGLDDMDGSEDQAHLVLSPSSNSNKLQNVFPPLNLNKGTKRQISGRVASPIQIETSSLNSPHTTNPMMSPQNLLPNSCRINFEKKRDYQGSVPTLATDRKARYKTVEKNLQSARSNRSGIPDDRPAVGSGNWFSRGISSRMKKNPFSKVKQEEADDL